MECEQMLALLNEYVDGTIDPAICDEFEKHMAGCNPCQVVVDNIRKTLTLYKEGKPYEVPAALRHRLHAALLGIFILKRVSFVSSEIAHQLLRQGALVIDVRNPSEFNSGHLPGALSL